MEYFFQWQRIADEEQVNLSLYLMHYAVQRTHDVSNVQHANTIYSATIVWEISGCSFWKVIIDEKFTCKSMITCYPFTTKGDLDFRF